MLHVFNIWQHLQISSASLLVYAVLWVFSLENADRQALWDVLSAWWVQATPPWGTGPHWTTVMTSWVKTLLPLLLPLLCLILPCASISRCGKICQTLLAKSGVAPNKVLFVDDSAKNIQSVRRVVRCCAFFATLIVASSHRISMYLPEFRCYRLVSPKQFPFSMWSKNPMDFQHLLMDFPGHWESVLFICQKGWQKQHGVIPWRCIELIRILLESLELPAERAT